MTLQDALSLPRTRSIAPSSRPVRLWLIVVAALIFAMVLVGGATRLTKSGLSITEWAPVTGVVPPLGDAAWSAEFSRYQQIPQFSKLNSDMTLSGFKTIYWWEWSHRLLARVIGLAFIIPALAFWIRGDLKGRLRSLVLFATALLALEPIVGWWMVASGLSVRTEVAQERLAMHLLIAAATFATLIYAAVGSDERLTQPVSRRFVAAAHVLLGFVFVQLGLGALVAGLHAGLIYNTWPLMNGKWIPEGTLGLTPWWKSLWDDVTTVQFDHRVTAYIVVIFAIIQAAATWRAAANSALAMRAFTLAGVALLQAALGIMTLLWVVPLNAALGHQAFALVLLGLAAIHASATRSEAEG